MSNEIYEDLAIKMVIMELTDYKKILIKALSDGEEEERNIEIIKAINIVLQQYQ